MGGKDTQAWRITAAGHGQHSDWDPHIVLAPASTIQL